MAVLALLIKIRRRCRRLRPHAVFTASGSTAGCSNRRGPRHHVQLPLLFFKSLAGDPFCHYMILLLSTPLLFFSPPGTLRADAIKTEQKAAAFRQSRQYSHRCQLTPLFLSRLFISFAVKFPVILPAVFQILPCFLPRGSPLMCVRYWLSAYSHVMQPSAIFSHFLLPLMHHNSTANFQ